MADGHSRAELLSFLDFLKDKGLINPATASARKAAVSTLFSILSDDETHDITNLDIEQVSQRFANLKGDKFKPESLRVYRSRVESALRDFMNYKKDPLGYKPAMERARRSSNQRPQQASRTRTESDPESTARASAQPDVLIFPIPIRPDVVVKIAGIPADLSPSEAKKIANVVTALAVSETD